MKFKTGDTIKYKRPVVEHCENNHLESERFFISWSDIDYCVGEILPDNKAISFVSTEYSLRDETRKTEEIKTLTLNSPIMFTSARTLLTERI